MQFLRLLFWKGLIVVNLITGGRFCELLTTAAKVPDEVEDQVKGFEKIFKNCKDVLVDFVTNYWLRVIGAIVLFFIGRKIISLISKLAEKALEKSSIELSVCKFLHRVIGVVLNAVLIICLLSCLNISSAPFVAILGSAGLAIGLALQGSFSNFAGGVLILILKPFKVNDYIINGDVEGKVKAIDIFYTKIVTPDNKKVVIPNGQLANSVTKAIPETSKRRIDIVVPVEYSADIKKIRTVLLDIANNNEKVKQSSGVNVVVESLDNSSIAIGFKVWVASGDYIPTKCELLEQIIERFREENIEIPFDQLDLNIKALSKPVEKVVLDK